MSGRGRRVKTMGGGSPGRGQQIVQALPTLNHSLDRAYGLIIQEEINKRRALREKCAKKREFTNEQVRDWRNRWAKKLNSVQELADEAHVTKSKMQSILYGYTYGWVI